ncbi:MAG: ferrous iron transport protein A [Fusobacteria bacterium]|nr:MAG: ferrous iron transport protein A [Fusobacteriota bacterium]
MVCPITFATPNRELRIVDILGGSKAKKKLLERGFCIGESLCITKGSCSKDIIIKTKTCKYAIGFGLASKIIVAES